MPGKVEIWLAKLSDPAGVNDTLEADRFSSGELGALEHLLEVSLLHNVRPSVCANLRSVLKHQPEILLSSDALKEHSVLEDFQASVEAAQLQDLARSALLQNIARAVMDEAGKQKLPVALVKGSDFAEFAYGGIRFRTFSDVDLLVDQSASADLGRILHSMGYHELLPHQMRMEKTERQWVRCDQHQNNLMIEVHTDLVHDPKLRRGMTLTYAQYADPILGGITAASRVVLAAVHGAASHLFGRLQYVLDGLAIVRSGVDGRELRERAEASGCVLPLATMLRLAYRLYGYHRCEELVGELGPVPFDHLQKWLISPAMVLGAKGTHRWRFLPQRYTYRRLLQIN